MDVDFWTSMGLQGKRAIIVHQDDLGMSHSANAAYLELGLPSGSVMVNGAWAPQLHGDDLGVHITLTSEFSYPRMRPITSGRSLRDPKGYLWSTLEEAWAHIDVEEAKTEIRAQLDAFLQLGLDPTHIDTHMGAVIRPDIALAYHDLAVQFGIPCLMPNSLAQLELPAPFVAPLEQLLRDTPMPTVTTVDTYRMQSSDRTEGYLRLLDELEPGVYHLIHHSALPGPDTMALPDAAIRIGDYQALSDERVRSTLANFTRLTYREVREAWRRGFSPSSDV
jgi:hypothetical protein